MTCHNATMTDISNLTVRKDIIVLLIRGYLSSGSPKPDFIRFSPISIACYVAATEVIPMVYQISERACVILSGCADLAHRLPPIPGIFLCAISGGFMVWLLSALQGWRPVVFSAVLVGLTNLILYVRLDAGQWSQGDAVMAALSSEFGFIFISFFEGKLVSDYPRLRWRLRCITPVLSVCFTLVLWMQSDLRG